MHGQVDGSRFYWPGHQHPEVIDWHLGWLVGLVQVGAKVAGEGGGEQVRGHWVHICLNLDASYFDL